jgi:hypothetical protein
LVLSLWPLPLARLMAAVPLLLWLASAPGRMIAYS